MQLQQIIVRFAIIFVLFQCIQGSSDYIEIKRHSGGFNSFQDPTNRDHTNAFLNIHNGPAADQKSSRVQRQSGGNNPSAYSTTFTGDDSDFIRTIYSGEGSAVNYLSRSYS